MTLKMFLVAAILAIAPSLVTSAASASPISYIRDTEIENAIRFYCLPIFNVADLDANDVKIHLINDSRLNAFVANGQQIFMNTGTLMAAESPEEVIGVLAHETGHITGGHLSQLSKNIDQAQDIGLASILLGIPLAVLSGQPEVAVAALGLGTQVATRSLLKFTRQNEEAADQAAVTYLDQAKISSEGMVEFMERVHEQSKLYSVDQNPYTQTHPLTQDRLKFLRNHTALSQYANAKMDPSYYQVHERVRAKLFGHLESFEQVMQRYPESDQSIAGIYARAIAYKEHADFKKALDLIHKLQATIPDDPFFIEMEGDILVDAGRLEDAIMAYDKALKILPWAAMIHQIAARTRIETNDPKELPKAIKNLQTATRFEPEVSYNWRLLATAYGRIGDQANTSLALAEEALLKNQLQDAKRHSERAMDLLPRGSAGWLRAEDINIQSDELEKTIKKK